MIAGRPQLGVFAKAKAMQKLLGYLDANYRPVISSRIAKWKGHWKGAVCITFLSIYFRTCCGSIFHTCIGASFIYLSSQEKNKIKDGTGTSKFDASQRELLPPAATDRAVVSIITCLSMVWRSCPKPKESKPRLQCFLTTVVMDLSNGWRR